ncbi:hypothetical protein C1T31_13475 [Hanstruepera neustonica]|uniref:Glycosyl transferase family 1 domain-containing protein n=1 Tax=Hanstruepera neustonica TaxID=1445657 RepID=A0A2K1DVW9_9FLAO|nr:glycosyltransferase [Hanstruepera neustonica]PNQ72109.1 hypothetical protein C1T31_13475 [Hanstruepera neustonica]
MKKICFLVPSFPNVSETFVVNQLIASQKAGYDILVLTLTYLGVANSSQSEVLKKYNIDQVVRVLESGIPHNPIKRVLLNFYCLVKYARFIHQVKQASFYDRFLIFPFKFHYYEQFRDVSIFHAQFADSIFDLELLKSVGFLKGKLITTFHGYDAHFRDEAKRVTLAKKRYGAIHYSDYVTVNTPYLEDKVKALGCDSKKIQVIPMGVNLDFFIPQTHKQVFDGKRPLKLLSVGRLIELKGHQYAIDAVRLLKDWGFLVEYTIVGEGPLQADLETHIKSLALESIVHLVGQKSQLELKDLYNSHDVFLMSSITDARNRAEAQGLATAEAQAMKLAVVAFDCGGVPYTLIDGGSGFLVPEKQVNLYAKAIQQLIETPTLIETMGEAGRGFVSEEFSLALQTQKMIALYDSL